MRKKPLTRPAMAGENAIAGHPLPKGEGCLYPLILAPMPLGGEGGPHADALHWEAGWVRGLAICGAQD